MVARAAGVGLAARRDDERLKNSAFESVPAGGGWVVAVAPQSVMGPDAAAPPVAGAGDEKKGACGCERDVVVAAAAAAAAEAEAEAEAGCLLVDHGDMAVAKPTRVILLLPGDSGDGAGPAGDPNDGPGLKERWRDEAHTKSRRRGTTRVRATSEYGGLLCI